MKKRSCVCGHRYYHHSNFQKWKRFCIVCSCRCRHYRERKSRAKPRCNHDGYEAMRYDGWICAKCRKHIECPMWSGPYVSINGKRHRIVANKGRTKIQCAGIRIDRNDKRWARISAHKKTKVTR